MLADQWFAEGSMPLFLDERESGRLVDAACGNQHVIGPQAERSVAFGASKGDAFVNQALADALAARRRLDIEQAQLRHTRRLANDEHRPDGAPALLGDPAVLPGRIELA